MSDLIAAYVVVLGGLAGYAAHLRRRRRALRAEIDQAPLDPR